MPKVVIASTNVGKISEFINILRPLQYNIISQSHFDVPSVEEVGLSFLENALLKARHCCKHTNLPTMSDDSGLIIPYLSGELGIYSARYSGISDMANINKVLDKLIHVPLIKRVAFLKCVIVFMRYENDPAPLSSEGTLSGYITFQACGSNGFGYDPIFHVEKYAQTIAELDVITKNTISHRAMALKNLVSSLQSKFI